MSDTCSGTAKFYIMPLKIEVGSILLTAFRTAVYFDSASGTFRHAELTSCDRSLLIAYDGRGFAVATGVGTEVRLDFNTIMHPGGAGLFSFMKDGLFLSARPSGEIDFVAHRLNTWEKFNCRQYETASSNVWVPAAASGGTELIYQELIRRLGKELDKIHLILNARPLEASKNTKPVVCWIHNDIDCEFDHLHDAGYVDAVTIFVFVSKWQMDRFASTFNIPVAKCTVIRNAINSTQPGLDWTLERPWRFRCAFISAPYRGLQTLLDGWERLLPTNAELHIWSGTRLWGKERSDQHFYASFALAADLPNVTYHGIAPNSEIKKALRDMHFLTLPSRFQETFCISAVEAMATGSRVIAASVGALPETTGGFARLYDPGDSEESHVARFVETLQDEFSAPWGGAPELRKRQLEYIGQEMVWDVREKEWRALLKAIN